jgi:UDP-glucose 4-epimerase
MNLLLTGSTGFIASHLKPQLKEHAVTCMDKKTSLKQDVTNTKNLPNGKFDAIIHLAAYVDVSDSLLNPQKYCYNNVVSTLNLLEYARLNDINNFVFVSSAAVQECYSNPYAWSKATGESLCFLYNHLYGIQTKILRLFNIYGADNTKGVIYKLQQQILQNQPLTVDGDGSQTRDFIHVSDVCRAINKAVKDEMGLYEVGTGKETSINMLIENIQKQTRRKYSIVYNPQANIGIQHSTAKNPYIQNCIPLWEGLKEFGF